jgi:prepilin-type N-terminal cleavage/methylation domain-containing protein/prepilin-type processing-associated H-X9-DG protein
MGGKHCRAFTLIELLVVIAIIALLIGILLPALGAARDQSRAIVCGSRLQQLGVGIAAYLNDYDNTLPQYRVDIGGKLAVVGTLFGGKKGTLPAYGINDIGPERRPLNQYVLTGVDVPKDSDNQTFEMDMFNSPSDKGGLVQFVGRVESMYDLLGTSYTLNDHALSANAAGPEIDTLVPNGGGKMPLADNPSKVWVLGSHTMYNYDKGDDRKHAWYGNKDMRGNVLYLDSHVRVGVRVPTGAVNTTGEYTFLPTADWLSRP